MDDSTDTIFSKEDSVDIAPLTTFSPQTWQEKRDKIRDDIERAVNKGYSPTLGRFILSCFSAIPGVGGAVGGIAVVWSEKEQNTVNELFTAWFQLQEDELIEIGRTLFEVIIRLNKQDTEVKKRIESKEYLSLIKKAFRNWSAAESEQKRVLIRNLLSNAGAAKQLSTDDVLRLFIDWIDQYSEAHFAVIQAVYNSQGITRLAIWTKIHGQIVREDSADADLFKLLMSDLSQGHVIR